MRKDYRHSHGRGRQESSSSGIPPWFWMLTGFAPGILIATLIYLDKTDPTTHNNKQTKTEKQRSVRTATRTQTHQYNTHQHDSRRQNTHEPVNNRRRPDKIRTANKTTQPTDGVKFTFYQKLQKGETRISDRQLRRQLQRERKRRRAKARQVKREKHKQARLKRLAKQKKLRAAKRKRQKLAAQKRKNKKRRNDARIAKQKKIRAKKRKKNAKRKVAQNRKKQNNKKKSHKKTVVAKKKTNFPANVLIQAGSFREKTQAQRRKTKLARYGVRAAISPAKIKGETWYRVRVGPFRSYKEMKSKLARLRKKKIGVISIRVPAK